MKLLRFDLYGRMAHFRKFFSNVTSLSYYFPPRNTVTGIIAAVLGMQRDSYYEILSEDKLGISIQILREPRKLLVSTDYLDIKNVGVKSLRGMTGIKPKKIEYILAKDGDEIGYRIFVASKNNDTETLLTQLYSNLSASTPVYPIALGPAYCLARIDNDMVILQENVSLEYSDGSEARKIKTIVPSDKILKIDPKLMEGKRIMLEESLPPNFSKERKITGGSSNYVFEARGDDIDIFVKSEMFEVEDSERKTYGIFI
jgi:CRISPR-associated protein Cas5h